MNEAVDLAQNRHLWRLMSMYGARSMPEQKENKMCSWVFNHFFQTTHGSLFVPCRLSFRVCN